MSSATFQQTPVEAVRDYWNRRPCNIRHSPAPVGSRRYFDEVRTRKYHVEPHIPRFAQFERWAGKRVLEIGCGIGTDTISFAQAGAHVTAVDLSEKSLDVAQERVRVYGLQDNVRFHHANAEQLASVVPVEAYDLVYSFGVIHHTPNPSNVLKQAKQYLRPGGTLKVMVYNRHCWKTWAIVLRHGKGRFWEFDRHVATHSEAQTGCPVTYTYSRTGGRKWIEAEGFEVTDLFVDHIFPYRVADYVKYQYVKEWYFRAMPQPLFRAMERAMGWHLCLTAKA